LTTTRDPADGSRVVVKNLLSVEGLHWFLPNVIKNFSGFALLHPDVEGGEYRRGGDQRHDKIDKQQKRVRDLIT
jgi:hypothetical protein